MNNYDTKYRYYIINKNINYEERIFDKKLYNENILKDKIEHIIENFIEEIKKENRVLLKAINEKIFINNIKEDIRKNSDFTLYEDNNTNNLIFKFIYSINKHIFLSHIENRKYLELLKKDRIERF